MSSPFDGSIVTDTGPLISLERLDGGYEFMRRMYRHLIAPPAVLRELAAGQFTTPSSYLEYCAIADFVLEQAPRSSLQNSPWQNDLHPGELEALALAQELHLPLLIEEAIGRKAAQAAGLPFSGMAGQVQGCQTRYLDAPTRPSDA